jgi:hypothetical protein
MTCNSVRQITTFFIVVGTVAFGPGNSSAKADRDVFLANVGGQVAIGSANDTSPAEPDLVTRVFERVMIPQFPPFSPSEYGLNEPGFFALPAGDAELPPGASALPGGAAVTVNLLPFTVGAGTDSLFFWNGAGGVNFLPIATAQPGVSLALDPNPIGSSGATGGTDLHPAYRLDLAGVGIPSDGVYLISPTVHVAGLDDSPRFFSLFLVDALVTSEEDAEALAEGLEMGQPIFAGKDFSFFEAAGDYVRENLVPEPTGFALAVTAVLTICGAFPSLRFRRPRQEA